MVSFESRVIFEPGREKMHIMVNQQERREDATKDRLNMLQPMSGERKMVGIKTMTVLSEQGRENCV